MVDPEDSQQALLQCNATEQSLWFTKAVFDDLLKILIWY